MKKDSPAYIITFMIIISIVFGSGVALVQNLTLGRLQQNQRLYRNRTIANAFGLKVEQPGAVAYEQAIERNLTLHEFTDNGRLWNIYIRKENPRNVGFVFSGVGFWDVIRGILVMSPDLNSISSIRFLDQKETPGLGARIEENWFTGQFQKYRINWNEPKTRRVKFGSSGGAPETLSAITGATQTSMALEKILNSELAAFYDIYNRKIAPTGQKQE